MKIRKIEAFPVRYPVAGHFKFLQGPKGSPGGRPAVLVRITAEDGTSGWGQSVPIPSWSYETLESVVSTIRLYLAPELMDIDAFDLDRAHEVMNRCVAGSFSTGMPLAKAGIDLALHDLWARATGRRLADLWGRPSLDRIRLSWTVNPRTIDEVDSLLEEGWSRGYRNFNVKVAPDLELDVEVCRRVRQNAPDGFLWADANGGYVLETAVAAARRLADVGVDVLEQPLRPNQLSGYRQLKKLGALPILMDEGVVSPEDLKEFMRLGLLDGVAMKPARCGGLLPARRQIEILLDSGLLFLGSGLTDPDVSLAASLALYAAYGYSHPAALNGPQFLRESVLERPLLPVDGFLEVPRGTGLGVSVEMTKVEALLARLSWE